MTRMCCVCSKVEQGGEWLSLHRLSEDARVTHGYCPVCFAETMAEIEDFIGEKAVKRIGVPGRLKRKGLGGSCV